MTNSSPVRPTDIFDIEGWAARTARPGDFFREDHAQHVILFFESKLTHARGRWRGQAFRLIDWQRALLRTVFGWKRADGTRRFRLVYVEVPRKNGKTSLAAGVALYLAFCSGEHGAEVYCAATDKNQAMICFAEAKRLRAGSTHLVETTEAYKHVIASPGTWSKLEAISADAETKHGLNVSGFIGDELHEWRDRALYETLHTGQGAREQPLEFLITTAGTDQFSLCYELRQLAMNVRDGVVDDPEVLPVIFAADREADPFDPASWAAANPSLGETIHADYLAKEAHRAKLLPRYLNAFKRLHLNIWTDAQTLWLPRQGWRDCDLDGAESVTLQAFKGREVWLGLDLSSTTDLTALVAIARREGGGYDVHCRFFLPAQDLDERAKRDRVPYDRWAEQGFITLTPGNVIDYAAVREAIMGPGGIAETAHVQSIAIDRWNSSQLVNELMEDGAPVVAFGQGFASMSAPSKELERLVLARELNHGGNPVLDWMASVVSVASDPADNIKPVKPDRRKTPARIDGIVALVMAIGRATAGDTNTLASAENVIL